VVDGKEPASNHEWLRKIFVSNGIVPTFSAISNLT